MSDAPTTYTQKGIAAVKAGNLHLAKQFLDAAINVNPNDAQAWLWMSAVVQSPAQKRECLKRVLAIDPAHAAARHGLEMLGPEPATPFVAAAAPEPEPIEPVTPAPALSAPSKPAATPKPRQPPKPPKPRSASRRPAALLIVLAVAAVGVVAAAAALLTQRQAPAPVASNQTPITVTRPPTWTPEPTAAQRPSPTPRPAPEQLQPLVEEAIRIRELEPIASIHYVLSAQYDLDLYLRNDLDAQAAVFANTFWDEMRALGLVQFDVEYDREEILDSTGAQLGGFYSMADQTLYAVTHSSRIEPSEYSIIVHEYTHALTDMHFDLSRLYARGRTSTDADLAARALAEGDATLVENSSPWGSFGPAGWNAYASNTRAYAPLFRQSGVSPALLYIQYFPYVEGWRFVWTLRESGGWEAVNRAYTDFPVSTEQILHPDQYQAGGDAPREVTLPPINAPAARGHDLIVAGDTLGEFVTSLVLNDFLDDTARAERAAAGWGGDVLRVWHDGVGRLTYVWRTAWDTQEDAREFFQAASSMLKQRTASNPPTGAQVTSIYFDGEAGAAYLSLNADEVLIILSPDADLRGAILLDFPDF